VKVGISERGTVTDISVCQHPGAVNVTQYLLGLSGHDVNDLEFALAQRKAMSRRCPETDGEHTCALAPDHDKAAATAAHQCRGCDRAWAATAGRGQDPGAAP
jgi:hypothetical protein